MAQEKIQQLLNKQVATWSVLYVKLHNYHWYVKGPHFFTLHEKFEELYNEAGETVDELAERLLALKGQPVATMDEFLQLSAIKEGDKTLSPDEMVRDLVRDYEKISDELKSGIDTCGSLGDDPTQDMLIGLQENIEKHAWMLRAYTKETSDVRS
ncbi:Dps family protein [Shouchella clausii]|jgi:starvation-inducible DNA-binding protein|uniref:DNA starvation/stationary phase protection protein n=1 Tax=Shouchella clausii TaxID=79880 RepID=A0A268S1Z6_SHOCL|nr:Dps family protein [Shouchella clausii]PAD42854.1 DNA starvation/stationary phase protection protein [Bacillus sp. 7520-S]SPU22347.1 general stress protein 20U Dps [Niallia circulans]AST98305.1 DNA starvation/stationary phase protection protein [Shouchella clausii]MBU8595136.1 DNA starvation/stationary phase protection protein [Shouchella clausii]MCM3550100.1 DNA starvation/stationary phase protection protein [Shouchella clausii]